MQTFDELRFSITSASFEKFHTSDFALCNRFHISMKTDAQILTKIEKKIVEPLSKTYFILVLLQESFNCQGTHPSHCGHIVLLPNGPSHISLEGISEERVL